MNDMVSMIKKDRDYVCNLLVQSTTFSSYLLVFSFKRRKAQLLVFSFYLLVSLFFSCGKRQNYLEEALRLAGENRAELEKVLAHYRQNPEDSLKYKAAVFLIENMPGHYSIDYPEPDDYYDQIRSIFAYENKNRKQTDSLFKLVTVNHQQKKPLYDVRTIKAEYLINQIEQAFVTRNYPWSQSLPWEDFCEYVLPYRSVQEPLEDWRPLYRQQMAPLLDSLIDVQAPDSIVCKTFISFFKPKAFVLVENSFPLQLKPSLYMEMNTGNCNDLALLGLYAMQVAGLPVTYDFTPQWANRSMGHQWNTIISNGKPVDFMIDDIAPYSKHIFYKGDDKLAKVYRRMFSLQKESLAMQFPEEEIPPVFRNPYIKDISEYYFNPVDIKTDLIYPPPSRKKYAYMMVFNNKEWSPVAWGHIQNRQAIFPKMSTGCVYLVMYYDNGKFHVACDPFHIDNEGNRRILRPILKNQESITISRKYYFREIFIISDLVSGGKFQIANRADFKDAITVHVIDSLRSMTFQHVYPENIPACKYFRFLSSDNGNVSLSELMVYDTEGRKLTGKIIGTDGSRNNSGFDKTKVFDGDNLTYFDAPTTAGSWVGLEFDKKEKIHLIKYLPRNDDNHINENELYELYYFDREWISLGQKTGDNTHVLKYDNVPENALLVLRNHTKGKEERIFTYENGKQVFY